MSSARNSSKRCARSSRGDTLSAPARRLRAYALTMGRTHANDDITMDAMLLAVPVHAATAQMRPLTPEQMSIVSLCAQPLTPVDLSAALLMPLGVIRVLVSDLVADGYLSSNTQPPKAMPTHQDLALLEELLNGIEAL